MGELNSRGQRKPIYICIGEKSGDVEISPQNTTLSALCRGEFGSLWFGLGNCMFEDTHCSSRGEDGIQMCDYAVDSITNGSY